MSLRGFLYLLAAAAGVFTAIKYREEIFDWFNRYRAQIDNKNTVARTILDSISSGKYNVRYGVFNKIDHRFIHSNSQSNVSVDSSIERVYNYGRIRVVDWTI